MKTHSRSLSTGSSRSNQSGESTKSDGNVVARVLGSFRHKPSSRYSDQQTHTHTHTPSQAEKKDSNSSWVANYKPTHYPDRPRVDKRTRTRLTDEEYAARIQKMQDRNQRYYDDMSSSRRHRPSLQTNVPNFSYSSRSPKSNRDSPPPPFSKTDWLPAAAETAGQHQDWEHDHDVDQDPVPGLESKGSSFASAESRSSARSSACSPSACTVKIYRQASVDHGISVRETMNCDKPLPSKAFNPNEPYPATPAPPQKHPSRRRTRKRSSSMPRIETIRESTTSVYNVSDEYDDEPPPLTPSSPDLVSSASTTHSSPSIPSLATPLTSPAGARVCPMPGCGVVLLTDADRTHNLCADCRTLQPRESTFYPVAVGEYEEEEVSPVVAQANLKKFQSLGRGRVSLVDHTPVVTEARRSAQLASKFNNSNNSNSNSNSSPQQDFKLQAAPKGGKKKQTAVPARRAPPQARKFAESDYSRHIGFQMKVWDMRDVKKPEGQAAGQVQRQAREASVVRNFINAGDLSPETALSPTALPVRCPRSRSTFGNAPAAPLEKREETAEDRRLGGRVSEMHDDIDDIIQCYVDLGSIEMERLNFF
ncbi:hypothetical protein F5B20DRAFT_469695 [Whalleya microplaca]|nr:hypothetical protein F5B20DRAFT_469695 [Whalleya microplaca]